MRSIEGRFLNLQKKRPAVSSLLNLAGAVKGQNFSVERISRALTRLVEKDDYAPRERPSILRHLVTLSQSTKVLEAYGKQGQNALTERKKRQG